MWRELLQSWSCLVRKINHEAPPTHIYIYSDYMHTPAACSVFCADTNYKLIGRPVEGCRGWWIVIILIPHGINIPWTNGTLFLQINQVNFWVEFYSWWVLNIIFKNAQVHAMFFILFNFCVNFYWETQQMIRIIFLICLFFSEFL